jgi:hypothetical protein
VAILVVRLATGVSVHVPGQRQGSRVAQSVLSAFREDGPELVREAQVDVVQKPRLVALSGREGLPVIRPESMPSHSFWPYPQCRIRKAKQILAACAVDRLHGHALIDGSDKSGKIGGIRIVPKVTF